jgi:hypothetical protein
MFRDPEAAKSYKKYMSSRKICKKTINACLIRMGLGTIKDMDRMVKYVMDPTSCRDPLVRRIEKEAMMK